LQLLPKEADVKTIDETDTAREENVKAEKLTNPILETGFLECVTVSQLPVSLARASYHQQ
jgi:hypothetical protein